MGRKCFVCISICIFLEVFVNSYEIRSFTGKEFEGVVIPGNFNQSYHQYVNSNRRIYFIFNSSKISAENKSMAIRFEVAAVKFDESRPLMMVVETDLSIYSWKIPVVIRNSSYFNFTRTLCPEWKANSSSNFAVFILSTTSLVNISFEFAALMEDIRLINSRDVVVTPTSPVYFFYEIPEGIESMIVKAESVNNSCAVFSIQEALCPVYDMVGILEHSKYYATMTKKGAITVTRSSLKTDAFFIILSMQPENFDSCASRQELIPSDKQWTKSYHVEVKESISKGKLELAIVVGFSCFLAIYIFTFFALVMYCYKCKSCYEWSTFPEPVQLAAEEADAMIGSQPPSSYGACDTDPRETDGNKDDNDDGGGGDEDDNEYEIVLGETNDAYRWARPNLCVSHMVKEKRTLTKKKRAFLWDLVTVAIFYFLPVIQLVLNFQKTLNNTGDQDICYYNFYCIHQVGPITAFNSFFSNIGYVMLGLLFLFLVFRRENSYMKLISLDVTTINYGIPQRYDLFYAMGLSLVMEGLLSACYHICPSYSNFQFDTSFMYVIGWLCMLKIYQNRHQDMSLKAHVAYSIIAFVVLLGVLGITEGSLAFWVCFVIIYLLFIFYLSIQVYYLGHWKLDSRILNRIFIRIKHEESLFHPMYLDRLVLLVFGNLANWALAIYGAILMPSNFATYLLTIMLANFMMYFSFYFIMKIKYRERIFIGAYMFLFLAATFWAFSLYFFFNQLVIWELSPALSREHNSDCLWLDFYDHHDIWHFLSALSLFFSFLVLLTLDDGMWNVPRNQIKVF